MNILPFRMSPLRLSSVLLLAGLSLSGISCAPVPTMGPDGNVFVNEEGPNRFGYNGVDSPNRPAARPRDTSSSSSSSSTKPKKSTPKIVRNPDNTKVDITPPEKKTVREDTPPEPDEPKVEPKAEPKETPPPAAKKEDLPYGTPVVGKKGLVYSPYAADKGGVDVNGIPAGTKVKCPYTGKAFRVP